MVTFDDVLGTLVRTCEEHEGFSAVDKAVVVRDLRGRVRLTLQPAQSPAWIGSLSSRLKQELGAWFEDPILGSDEQRELGRLRATVLGLPSAPWRPDAYVDAAGQRKEVAPGRWHLVERHLSKLDWLGDAKVTLPWPLAPAMPSVVTFYSFKGGVGRTTLLASVAWQLAKARKHVVAIDLDVEAPGLGSLLGSETERGLVDFLVDHAATSSAALDGLLAPAKELGADQAFVDVIPAGRVERGYFEKLARLDFSGSGLFEPRQERPVRDALRALMYALVKRAPRPDFILLDSRAGLHDLAGLSLEELAHVDVLVGRDSDQSYRGLELAVEALGRRRSFQDNRVLVVHTMAPVDPKSRAYEEEAKRYRDRSFRSFEDHVYEEDPDDAPTADDDTLGHYPRVVRFNQRLLTVATLASVERELVDDDDYRAVAARVEELSVPESE
jgi:MinD-like ATPase involved in chromosome partitioning or flagellar assembly